MSFTPRKKLTDILHDSDRERLNQAWSETEAAGDFQPIPSGEYAARIIDGEISEARKGTKGYKLTFEVTDGEHKGRRVWHDVWLTQAALPMAKRDLGKLGVTSLEQLDQPLPAVFLCKIKLVLRREDDGSEYNRVRSFEVLGIEPPDGDPFAPGDNPDSEPSGPVDTSFNPTPNASGGKLLTTAAVTGAHR